MTDAFEANYKSVLAKINPGFFPSKTQPAASGGHYTWASSDGWTAGFFPGLLWQLANSTGDAVFKEAAAAYTAPLEHHKTETSGHDIGFEIFGSFGNGLQLGSANASYADVVVEAAHHLAMRYDPAVGMTRSWGAIGDAKSFEVIIDNLMNLELLFWAAEHTGNATLGAMAASHATKTGKLWIRADGSTAHLCVFDPKTGKLLKPCTGTPQGLDASSTWARGQAWAVYGFTLAYRYTRDAQYLGFAKATAAFYIAAARSGGGPAPSLVPMWDFNATAPADYPDTSAAAITASALLELAVWAEEPSYRDAAVQILHSIGWMPGLRSAAGASDAVLAANQHDCKTAACTLIETEYYAYEAIRRLGGALPPAAAAAAAAA